MKRFLAVLLAAGAVLMPAAAARADAGTVTKYPPLRSVQFTNGDGDVPVVETDLDLVAGDRRHLHARLEVVSSLDNDSPNGDIVALNAVVKCFGTGLIGQATTSRNHEGKDGPYAEPGHLPLYVDLLVSVTTAGTYHCGLYAKTSAGAPIGSDYTLAVVTGGKSWLEISDSPQPGAEMWENPVCGSTGADATCTYVGPSNDDAFVFYDDGTPVRKWTRGAGASAVQALANVTVTTCYTGTSSCAGIAAGDQVARTASSKSVVSFRLDVLQMDAAGSHTCRTTQSAVQTNNITDNAHHYTTYLSIPNVAVDKNCGDKFLMRVYVKHVSGSGIKIDGRQGATALTNGIMMNLY